MKRSTQYWRQRERSIMVSIGLTPTPNSGAGALWKEDGNNETYIAQLKSTEGKAIAITLQALKDLTVNAIVSHRIPLFVLDFAGIEPLVCLPASHFLRLEEAYHATTTPEETEAVDA